MPLTAGTRLGPYEILSPLGAGGMGEVYKARDTRLDRMVAIKILPAALAADPLFRQRFDREARAISSLDHPHICALYDVGEEQGMSFLVMQLLDGETLAARIERGALPVEEAVALALQIADALDRAHRAGIVHRDLKPGNVFVVRSGAASAPPVAKLLDFGLAKEGAGRAGQAGRAGGAGGGGGAGGDVTAPPTRTFPLTAEGTILGTLQYMAPEQLEGADADERADIWAFGAVLYEMVTAQKAFEAKGQASLIGAIMTTEPAPVSQHTPLAPRTLDRLVAGCLVKDREDRWQSIRDVKRQLGSVLFSESASAPPAARRSWARIVAASALAFVIGTAALTVLGLRIRRDAPVSVVRFDVGPPGGGAIPAFADTFTYASPSPDGSRVAFLASLEGAREIWIKALDQPKAEVVSGTRGAESPFWSPDGRSIAFFAGGQLKKKSLDGGPPQTLCPAPAAHNGTWSANGTILFDTWGLRRLMRVSQDGGAPVVEREDPGEHRWPQFLPDGIHYLFAMGASKDQLSTHAFVGALGSTDVTAIPDVTSRVEYAAGRLLFLREGTLLAQPFDLGTHRLTGTATPISELVHGFASTGFGAFSATPRLLVFQSGLVSNRLVWFDRQGRALESVGSPGEYIGARISPDGSMVATSARDPKLGTTDIWLQDLKRNITRHFTNDKGIENLPAWSADSGTLVYPADRRGPPHLHARDVNGSEEREVVAPMPLGPQIQPSLTPDGRSVLFSTPAPDTGPDIFIAPLDGSGPAVPLVHSKARETGPRVSPNGRWLAYVSDESGRLEVYVRPFAADHPRVQLSRAGGTNVRWRADSREVFYSEGGARVIAADVAASPMFEAGAPRVVFAVPGAFVDYDVTADGQKFLFVLRDPEAEAGTLSAILNWPALLKK